MQSTLLVSTMVAMEITLHAIMKTRGYPDELLEKVFFKFGGVVRVNVTKKLADF